MIWTNHFRKLWWDSLIDLEIECLDPIRHNWHPKDYDEINSTFAGAIIHVRK